MRSERLKPTGVPAFNWQHQAGGAIQENIPWNVRWSLTTYSAARSAASESQKPAVLSGLIGMARLVQYSNTEPRIPVPDMQNRRSEKVVLVMHVRHRKLYPVHPVEGSLLSAEACERENSPSLAYASTYLLAA